MAEAYVTLFTDSLERMMGDERLRRAQKGQHEWTIKMTTDVIDKRGCVKKRLPSEEIR